METVAQGHGAIALVGSVAGYGGLPKATVYGPSKAALINFAEVLHLDLAPRGIGVFMINPGFVATPLTAHNDYPMPFLMDADHFAARALFAIERLDHHTLVFVEKRQVVIGIPGKLLRGQVQAGVFQHLVGQALVLAQRHAHRRAPLDPLGHRVGGYSE